MGYKVVVEKGDLRFDAAHFITYGGKCERLHGHSYGLSVTVEGPLSSDAYVYDFVDLKAIVRRVRDTLDHRFLLPAENPHLSTAKEDGHWEIRFLDRRYVFPERDVAVLPVDNITAERLAAYIWDLVAEEMGANAGDQPATMTVGVEEAPGQTAYFSQAFKR